MKLDLDLKNYIPKNSDKNNFSHVYMHVPESEELIETRGKLFSAIDIKSKDTISMEDITNSFLDDLEREYFGDEVSSIVNILDKSMSLAYDNLSKKVVELNLSSSIDFNAGCFVLWGDIAYMARIGNSSIYLYREGKLMNLSEHLLSVGNSVVFTASGYVKEGDIFVLTTSNFSTYINESKIKEIISMPQEDISELDLDDKNISFLILSIKNTGVEIKDEFLEEDKLYNENVSKKISIDDNEEPEDSSDEKDLSNDTPSTGYIKNEMNNELDEGASENSDDVVEDKEDFIKSSLNDLDLKNKTKNISSYIINTTKQTSSNIYKNINENMRKIDWNGIFKSITVVIVSFFQLIFNLVLYLKDRSQKQYKLKINRDLETLKREKNTVIGIVIFIILILVIFHFFF